MPTLLLYIKRITCLDSLKFSVDLIFFQVLHNVNCGIFLSNVMFRISCDDSQSCKCQIFASQMSDFLFSTSISISNILTKTHNQSHIRLMKLTINFDYTYWNQRPISNTLTEIHNQSHKRPRAQTGRVTQPVGPDTSPDQRHK